jgi:hypothetical protein
MSIVWLLHTEFGVILMQFSAQVSPNSSSEMNLVTILHTTFEGLFCDN